MLTTLLVLVVVAVLLSLASIAAHFLPKSSNVKLATIETDLNWLYDKVFPPSAAAAVAGLAPVAPAAPLAHVITAFGAPLAPGDYRDTDYIVLSPVTPAALFAAFLVAPQAEAPSGKLYDKEAGTWSQIEWLRRMNAKDPKTFANWCADALKVPGVVGGGDGVGWLTNLSAEGQLFFESIGSQRPYIAIPDVDPRVPAAAEAPKPVTP